VRVALSATPDTPWPEWEEHDPVMDWRMGELLRMDFTLASAAALAQSDVDLHRIERMLKNGCTHALVIEIVL